MYPALSQVCCLQAPFESDIHGFADAAGNAIELWLTKLEEYLKTRTVADVRKLAEDREQKFVAASFQGGLLFSQGDARREAWGQFERRLDLLAELSVPVLVVAPDFIGTGGHGTVGHGGAGSGGVSPTDIERAQISLKQAGVLAAPRGVKLALEFQGRAPFVNNLETAASLVASIEEPNVGLCFDVFHYYSGPSKFEDLACLSTANLFHVQFCDLSGVPREFASDSQRILPGDGDYQLGPIVDHLARIGYAGAVSLEVMNPQLWPIAPQQVGEVGLTALRMALKQATGGA